MRAIGPRFKKYLALRSPQSAAVSSDAYPLKDGRPLGRYCPMEITTLTGGPMRHLIFTAMFLSLLLIICSASAQEARFGIGAGNGTGQPLPAQGNSANIDFTLMKPAYAGTVGTHTVVRFDSKDNIVSMSENALGGRSLVPLLAGTDAPCVELPASAADVAKAGLVQFCASMVLEQRSTGYAWYMNYNSTDFQAKLSSLGGQGLRIESIDTYGRNVFDYAGTWTQDTKGWAYVLNYTSANLIATLNAWPLGTTRYRPIHFAVNPSGSQLLYAAVAAQDNLGFAWILNEGNYSSFINSWIPLQYSANRRLVDIQLTRDLSGYLLCSGITKDATYAQKVGINLDWTTFSSLNTQYGSQGYRLIDFDKYCVAGVTYYAGLWNNDGLGFAYALDHTNLTTFQSTVTNYISQGFKPVAIDVYDGDWVQAITTEAQPTGFFLAQNFPNPFNPSTTIAYEIPSRCFVTLSVYNVLGEDVATLVSGETPAGKYNVIWSAANLPSGMYFYRLQAGNQTSVKKLQILK